MATAMSNSEAVGIIVQNELLPLVQAALPDAPNLKLIITAGEQITEETGKEIEDAGIEVVERGVILLLSLMTLIEKKQSNNQ